MVHKKYNLVFKKIKQNGKVHPICTTINAAIKYTPLASEICLFISGSYKFFINDISKEIQKMWDGTWEGLLGEDNIFENVCGDELEIDLSTGNAYVKICSAVYTDVPTIPIRDLKLIFDEFIEFRDW